MEKLFDTVTKRNKRCPPDDPRIKRLRVKMARMERELVVLSLVPGLKVWFTGLKDTPLLNGEYCKIVEDCTPRRNSKPLFVVRRFCSEEIRVVPGENLTEEVPDPTGACVKVRAVLTRGLGRELAARVMSFLTCPRCYSPSSPDVRCEDPHAVSHRKYIGHSRRYSEESYDENYACRLCQSEVRLDRVSDENGAPMQRKELKDCLQGEHSFLFPSGRGAEITRRRRCVSPFVDLDDLWISDVDNYADKEHAYSELQTVLDGLPCYVESIKLDGSPIYDAVRCSLANIPLPKLFSVDLSFYAPEWTFVLNPELTPNLNHLALYCESAGPAEISVVGNGILPALKSVTISGLVIGERFQEMLAAATRLENVTFFEVQLPVSGRKIIEFASCALRVVDFYCAQGVEEVSVLGAPNVHKLSLHFCESLKVVKGVEKLCCLEELSVNGAGGVRFGFETLHLASNALRGLHLYGMPDLKTITLWAPSLTRMDLGDCKNLENVSFLNDHEFKSGLPAGYVVPALKVTLAHSPAAFCGIVAAALDMHSNCQVGF